MQDIVVGLVFVGIGILADRVVPSVWRSFQSSRATRAKSARDVERKAQVLEHHAELIGRRYEMTDGDETVIVEICDFEPNYQDPIVRRVDGRDFTRNGQATYITGGLHSIDPEAAVRLQPLNLEQPTFRPVDPE